MKIPLITRSRLDKTGGNDNQNCDPQFRPMKQQSGIWGLKSRLVPRIKDRISDSLRPDIFLDENRAPLKVAAPLTNKYLVQSSDPAASREVQIAYAIREIQTKKAATLDLDFIENILSADSFECSENTLWLGVCYRLRGKNPSPVLEPLLVDDYFSRTALVNICAYYAAESVGIDENPTFKHNFKQTVRTCLEKIDVHTRLHQWDTFARLVQAILLFRVHEQPQAIQILEEIYLDQPTYSPAISALASFYNLDALRVAAKDYAMEALSIDPTNSQAAAILHMHRSLPDNVVFTSAVSHLPFQIVSRFPQSVLFEEYDKLDSARLLCRHML